MVQGSYPRSRDIDEEKERLIKEDEEAQLFEVTEVSSQDGDEEPPKQGCRWMRCCKKNADGTKKQRPLWRRILRVFLSISLIWILRISISTLFMGLFT
jgi:hypothetical protein